MNPNVKVRISVFDEFSNEWNTQVELDRDGQKALIERAAGKSPPEWRYLQFMLHEAVEQAVIQWAEKERSVLVDRAKSELELLAMAIENHRSREERHG
jgi:hypothetical protein